MSKHQSAVMVAAQTMARAIIAEQTKARIMLGFDAAMLAANRCFNMGATRAAKFANCYNDAINELAGMYIDDCDSNGDKGIEYAKGKRDEIMSRFMGDAFVPFDAAYGYAYVDELKRLRVMQEKSREDK